MKLLNERNQVKDAAARWKKQYAESLVKRDHDIAEQLEAIDPETATASDVEAIVGNSDWARPQSCDECGASSWDVVRFGEEPDYGSSTAWVCVSCLRTAIAMVDAQGQPPTDAPKARSVSKVDDQSLQRLEHFAALAKEALEGQLARSDPEKLIAVLAEREAWRNALLPAFKTRMSAEQVLEVVQSAIHASLDRG